MRAATRWTTWLALTLLVAPLGAEAQTADTSTQEQSNQQRNAPTPSVAQPFSITIAGQYTTRQIETAGGTGGTSSGAVLRSQEPSRR